MGQNTKVLNKALSHVGEGGTQTWSAYKNAYGQAWCCQFVWRCFNEAGLSSLFYGGKKTAYAPSARQWCKANLATVPMYLAMPGDIIFFDWEPNGTPNHIGLVQCHASTDTVNTVEGNTGSPSRVRKRVRSSGVQDIWRPLFKPNNLPVEKRITVDGNFGFVSIYFLQKALGIKADCILGKATVKALQKKAGVSADGAWGKATSKAVQKMVGATVDGAFGKESVKALQKWINKQNSSPSEGVAETGSAEATVSETEKTEENSGKTVAKTEYTGTYPSLIPMTARLGLKYAYAYGTKKKTYRYKTGKAKAEYKTGLNAAYPNRSGWKYAKSRAGASCDVFAGTVLTNAGYKSPHAMSKFVAWCKANLKALSSPVNGCVATRTNHIGIILMLEGKKLVANAHYQTLGGTYGIVEKPSTFTKYWYPTEAKLTALVSGDKWSEVKNLQAYLNWYGDYGLALDYDFGEKTEAALKDFQSENNLEADGICGAKTIARMMEVTSPPDKTCGLTCLEQDDLEAEQNSSEVNQNESDVTTKASKMVEATSSGSQACKSTSFAYNKSKSYRNWQKVIRCKDEAKAEVIAKSAKQAVKRSNIKYSTTTKNYTLPKMLKAHGWDMSKVTGKCYTSCTPLAMACVLCAGIGRDNPKYYQWARSSTKSIAKRLVATGEFEVITDSEMLTKGIGMKRGDIVIGKTHGIIISEVTE